MTQTGFAMKEGGASLEMLVEGQTHFRTASELLQIGQYEQAAEVLHEAQVTNEQTGETVLAHILDAARRICLACSQCRVEIESHQQAYEEAKQREQELRQQIHAILDLISARDPPKVPKKQNLPPGPPAAEISSLERPPPEPTESLSLWQRIQSLLGWQPAPWSTEREVYGTSAKAPLLPATVIAKLPVVPAVPPVKERKWGEHSPPSLVVYCLGPFRVYQNDQLITGWTSLKGQCILKYLVAHRGRPISKDILMDLFWPDADSEVARRNLHQAIYSLRQTLKRGQPDFQHIRFENDCYLLNPEMDVWLDFREFIKYVQVGRRLEATGQLAETMTKYGIAEGLYQGDFLAEDLYEDWPNLQRERIRNMYLDIADRLSKYYVQQSEYTAAVALCQKILAQDNCYEEAHRRLMRCYLAQGQRHLAVRQYQTCVQALREELDLTPSEKTVELYQRITTGV